MYQKNFYVNVRSGRFCRADKPEEYGSRPSFRHGESAVFDIVCLNEDGTPFDVTGSSFILAADDNVDHGDELAVMSDDISASGNIIHVRARCFSAKFAGLVADGETVARFFELSRLAPGADEYRVFVYDDSGVRFLPRVRFEEGVPEEPQTLDFVSRSELVNAGYVSADNVRQVVLSSIGSTIGDLISDHDGENTAHSALFDGKAALEHSHEVREITGLSTVLDGKSPADHIHNAADTGAEPAGAISSHDTGTAAHAGLFAGMIFAYAGETAPEGYLPCNGAEVSRSAYSRLFAAIGTLYGDGDGESTFNIPDLRGKFIRGTGGNAAALGSAQPEGLPNISGSFGFFAQGAYAGGAVTMSFPNSNTVPAGTGYGDKPAPNFTLNASGSSAVYGASAHVTPENYAVNYCIRY